MRLLIRSGKQSTKKFFSSPEISALLSSLSDTTRYRDFKKMIELKLIEITDKNNETSIEPNFKLLEDLRYRV